jgi:hypothetical protein
MALTMQIVKKVMALTLQIVKKLWHLQCRL